ncbi:hypothetical protein [Myxococcus xanthus]|uniref:hypothetical protein n=1 Tax=Myxococcus xanthus TaxID=34 RepID=UPI0020A5DC0D|nr:hypothetical protein [Myxococcus xanthus]
MAALAEARVEQVAREDLVMFVNACFSCTGQREFYGDARGQSVSIEFLHQYILGNYRRLYARTLAAGINHFNQAQIILNLLASGSPADARDKAEEGALIAAALRALPPQRAFRVLASLRGRRINNRRARAIARDYVHGRANLAFDAVKYRSKLRAAVSHGHLTPEGELGPFLFRGWKKRSFTQPLLETFRRAHYTHEALYELPYTVAEGLAVKHGISREVFLRRIEPRLTAAERLRLQESAARERGTPPPVDLGRASLTKLALYVLALSQEARRERHAELHAALEQAAARVLRRAPSPLQRVAAILDNSYSSSGSLEKRRRPLGVALVTHYLLSAAAREYRTWWTCPVEEPLLVSARGQTDIATPLLEALAWGADLVVIVLPSATGTWRTRRSGCAPRSVTCPSACETPDSAISSRTPSSKPPSGSIAAERSRGGVTPRASRGAAAHSLWRPSAARCADTSPRACPERRCRQSIDCRS